MCFRPLVSMQKREMCCLLVLDSVTSTPQWILKTRNRMERAGGQGGARAGDCYVEDAHCGVRAVIVCVYLFLRLNNLFAGNDTETSPKPSALQRYLPAHPYRDPKSPQTTFCRNSNFSRFSRSVWPLLLFCLNHLRLRTLL